MSVASYSKCRIQFIPKERESPEVHYSDRTLIELRQYDFDDFSLRTIDVDNNRKEIFNVPFKRPDQYKRAQTVNQPDAIRNDDGLYLLWLNETTRDQFYQTLDTCIEQQNLISKDTPKPSSPPPDTKPKEDKQYTPKTQPARPVPDNRNDVLVDIYQLGQHIRQGDTDNAVALSRKLANQRISLQAKPWSKSKEEQTIQITIKIDSNDQSFSSRYDPITMDVFPSTKINELRTALEYCNFNLPANQYFFVNGHLAHENCTMEELNIQPRSLFILFIIQ
ncbi:unnamed protein product [Rotaria sp. Silwood2]|nr:unnamed protein product [Rotaria sp. Silwood2]CAF4375923.1 unnamed protein product [Rotaria sp. Silwood2]